MADKGYESREDLLDCVINGIMPNIALTYDKNERLYTIEYDAAEITEDIKNSTKKDACRKYPNRPQKVRTQKQ